MECIKIENLTFTYPGRDTSALNDINLSVEKGDFITVCGKSGCGKTTLLKLLKPSLASFGNIKGNVFFNGKNINEISHREHTSKIGFVMQNPDSQIVTDKVWHELAFGLESLGYSTEGIRAKVSEIASFFGIQAWFHKKANELSGGQKQLLNLASVMVMEPELIVLDEPTSRLDPVSCDEFINMLKKINTELGTTIIMAEHRLDGAFSVSNRVLVMNEGKIIADSTPERVGKILKDSQNDMYMALPAPMRIYGDVEDDDIYPVNINQGRTWLLKYFENNPVCECDFEKNDDANTEIAIDIKDVYFRYDKNQADVIMGLNLKIYKGEILSVVGGNGAGKSTLISLISGINKAYRGEVLIYGKKPEDIKNLYGGVLGVIPQNPQTLFSKKTVYLELTDMLQDKKLTETERENTIQSIAELCRISDILSFYPYDISGGEQQRVALAKILLLNPEILLLDEPTKGMDEHFKKIFGDILRDLKLKGKTIVLVSHDIEFCAEFTERCAMIFDGDITSEGRPREFFAGKTFYTTQANKIARKIIPNAVLVSDVIRACGKKISSFSNEDHVNKLPDNKPASNIEQTTENKKNVSMFRIAGAIFFAMLFVLTHAIQHGYNFGISSDVLSAIAYLNANFQLLNILSILFAGLCVFCIIPRRNTELSIDNNKKHNAITSIVSVIFAFVIIPLTIVCGYLFLGDRKYYAISILVVLEILVPFFIRFEGKRANSREVVLISAMCALAVSGRIVFYFLPQFKPVMALVIISGLCFGGETGFLVGAVTALVSNFFFGQSPLTPYQMVGFGIVGYLFGAFFVQFKFIKNKLCLSVLGALSTLLIYGVLLNTASVILWQSEPTLEMFAISLAGGFPFDLVHAMSTALFLYFLAEPLMEKIERIKLKYGLNTHKRRGF